MQRRQRPKTSLGFRAHVPADKSDANGDANNPDRLPSVDSVQKRMRKIAFQNTEEGERTQIVHMLRIEEKIVIKLVKAKNMIIHVHTEKRSNIKAA